MDLETSLADRFEYKCFFKEDPFCFLSHRGAARVTFLKTQVLLNPVFVYKIPISARVLHVCSFVMC